MRNKILMVIGIGTILASIVSLFCMRDSSNRYNESATVVSIQRYDTQIVRFETSDGNLWDTEFTLDEPIDIGDNAVLTFEEDNDNIIENNVIINVDFEGDGLND